MLSVFSSSKCGLFHNSNVFGSCITHILYTECAKIKKNNSGAKRLNPNVFFCQLISSSIPSTVFYFISKNPNMLVISQIQWLISAEV